MSARWKFDVTNPGSCMSVGKELSRIRPDYSEFVSDNLLSDASDLSPAELYDTLLSLITASYNQASALRVANEGLNDEIFQYKEKLQAASVKEAQLQQTLLSTSGGKSQDPRSLNPGPQRSLGTSTSSLDVLRENIKTWRLSATKIQSAYRGYIARRRFKDRIYQTLARYKPKAFQPLSNQEIMDKVSSAIEKKGLSLEQCYRAADIDCDGKITFEEIVKFLNDMKVSLPKSMVSRFMLIIDEDCSGVIEQKEYYHALTAYHVDRENHWTSSRSYEEEVLLKFVKIMDSRGIEPEEIFNLCDSDGSGTISLVELKKYLTGLKIGFQNKEIHALIVRLDANNSGELDFDEFKAHLNQGKAFFMQEAISSTSTMMVLPVKSTEIPELRDLIKSLEFNTSILGFLDKFQGAGIQIPVAKFYEELNTYFSCKLSKPQSTVFNKAISLSETGMVSIEKLRPTMLFYSSRSLSTKENYIRRVKMHSNTQKKMYDRNEMAKDWIFTTEQCNDMMKFFGNASKEFIDNDLLFVNEETVEVKKGPGGNDAVIQYFINKLAEIKLEITNIFRFADKRNEKTVKVTDFCLAFKKLVQNLQPDMLEALPKLFSSEMISMEQVETFFPSKKYDQNGLPLEKAYWIQRLAGLLSRSNIQPSSFYVSIPTNPAGKRLFKSLKEKIKDEFVLSLKANEADLMIKALCENEDSEITQAEFINMLRFGTDTNHNNSELREFGNQVKIKLTEQENAKKKLPPIPSQLNPEPVIKPGASNQISSSSKVNIAKAPNPTDLLNAKPLIRDLQALDIFRKISLKLDKNQWAGQEFLKHKLFPQCVLNQERLFNYTKLFGITKVESDCIFVAMDLGRIQCVYAYTFFTILDSLTYSLSQLPFHWNENIQGNTLVIVQTFAQGMNPVFPTHSLFPNLIAPVDLPLFAGFGAEAAKIRGCFHEHSPRYHLVAVLSSFEKNLKISGIEVLRSYILVRGMIKSTEQILTHIAKDKESLINALRTEYGFNPFEVESVFIDVYADRVRDFPLYNFVTFVELAQRSMDIEEIVMMPFKGATGFEQLFSKLQNIADKFNRPLFFYKLELSSEISVAALQGILKSAVGEDPYGYLDTLSIGRNGKVKLYHFLSVLDSYRKFPTNLHFDVSALLEILNRIPEEKINSLIKDKQFSKAEFEIQLSKNCDDLFFFLDPYSKGYVYGFQINCAYRARQNLSDFPFMLNFNCDQEVHDTLEMYAGFLDKNQEKTTHFSRIPIEEEVTEITLGQTQSTFKINPNVMKKLFLSLKNAPQDKVYFYYFLAAIETYRKVSMKQAVVTEKSIEELHRWERDLLNLLPSNKPYADTFNCEEIDKLLDLDDLINVLKPYKIQPKTSTFLFGIIDSRSFNQIFAFELYTFLDMLKVNILHISQGKGLKKFPYKNETDFEVDKEKERELQLGFTNIAKLLDVNVLPTCRRSRMGQTMQFQSASIEEFRSYLTRINYKGNCDLVYNSLLIEGKMVLYHFFAVVESYRLSFCIDKPTPPAPAVNPSQAINGVTPTPTSTKNPIPNPPAYAAKQHIFRNPSDLTLPTDTSGIPPGSFEHTMYQIKSYLKVNFNAAEKLFSDADKLRTGNLTAEDFMQVIATISPKVPQDHIGRLIKAADVNRDGKIDYEEFITYSFDYKFPVPEPPKPQLQQKPRQEVLKLRDKLTNEDFFNKQNTKCTTILNSEEAAIIRSKELMIGRKTPKFIDPDFGPEQGHNGDVCLYWDGAPPSSNFPNPAEIKWMSPSEWCENPEFFKGGSSSSDVIQGSLGDCWFIGALSVMALRDDLLYENMQELETVDRINVKNANSLSKGVCPPIFHGLQKHGMHVIRFFINSAWRWVIIDDRLPMCVEEGYDPQYVFGHCKEHDELWVALLEKAYAKIYGCYQALNGGLIDDALTDLTALVAENTKISGKGGMIDGPVAQLPDRVEELWARLMGYRRERTLMGCSIDGDGVEGDVVIDGERTGLLSRHAYAIIDVIQIPDPEAPKKRHRLLRIRNPWGQREWMGKWKDGSEEMIKHFNAINVELSKLGNDEKYNDMDSNDGTFLMCFKDWRSIYHNLYACVDFDDSWFGVRFPGEWTMQNSGGVPVTGTKQEMTRWAKNPQYFIELQQKTEVFISLAQEDGRYVKDAVFPFNNAIKTACFTVMKANPGENLAQCFVQANVIKLSVLKLHRNLDMRITLPPGKYFIVPATMQPDSVAAYWLSIYMSCPKNKARWGNCRNPEDNGCFIAEEEEDEDKPLTPREIESLKEIFTTLNNIK